MAESKISDGSNGDVLAQVERALKGLRFGSVELIVHDGRVLQRDGRRGFREIRNDNFVLNFEVAW